MMERKLFVKMVGAGALAALTAGSGEAEAGEVPLEERPGDGTLSVRPGDALVVRLDPEYLMTDVDMDRLMAHFQEMVGPGVDVLVCSGVAGLDVVRREAAETRFEETMVMYTAPAREAEELMEVIRREAQARARAGRAGSLGSPGPT